MKTIYVSGSPPVTPADGLSESNPWSLQQLQEYRPLPGDTIRLQGGVTYPLAIDWRDTGDPDRLKSIVLTTYGDGLATIASGDRDGLVYSGPGALRLLGLLHFKGEGPLSSRSSGVLIEGNPNGEECAYLRFAGIRASGYGMGGLTISTSTPIRHTNISHSIFEYNAAGIHVSGGRVGELSSRTVFNLTIENVIASDNDWEGSEHGPYGLSLNGISGVQVHRCYCNRNGRLKSGAGHGGILLRLCDNVEVWESEFVDNSDPDRGSDGQGCVLDGVQKALIHYNLSRGNLNGGLEVMDESDGEWSTDVTLRHNVSIEDNTGLMFFLHGGRNIRAEFNHILRSRYKALDLSGSGPDDKLMLLGNAFSSPMVFAMEAELPSLLKTEWLGNFWPEGKGFNVLGLGYHSSASDLREKLEGVR